MKTREELFERFDMMDNASKRAFDLMLRVIPNTEKYFKVRYLWAKFQGKRDCLAWLICNYDC